MTPGLSKDIRCHALPYFFFNLKTARSDISPHIKWAVSLVFAYGHFNVPLGREWVSILSFMLVKRIVIAANFVHETQCRLEIT